MFNAVGAGSTGHIFTLTNSGTIQGGGGGRSGGQGGAGISNSSKIDALINHSTISGGRGGTGARSSAGGAGGAGIENSAMITSLTNSGTISGGDGGAGTPGGAGGLGLDNTGSIGWLTNTGVIENGSAGANVALAAALIGGAAIDNSARSALSPGTASSRTRGSAWRSTAPTGRSRPSSTTDASRAASLGADDALTNSGQIDGNLILARADTINDEGGTISGAIYASANDLLSFSGRDGAVTIDDFVASGAANDYPPTLSAGGAMTQVGSDVVIKPDATDSITLVGVSLATFTAADLKLA